MSDMATLHQQGRLSQTCPKCGLVEAAGSYSTCHLVPTGPADWFEPVRSEAQQAATRVARHSQPVRAVALKKTANPEVVA